MKIWNNSIEGKTVIITGGNRGLGYEVAIQLAELNATEIIIACRDIKAGENAARDINSSCGRSVVKCWQLDLASFDSVISFVKKFNSDSNRKLHILIQNACIVTWDYANTIDGWERSLQVNYLAPCLLSLLLLPRLRQSSSSTRPSRLVVVSSYAHYWIKDLPPSTNEKSTLEILSSPKFCSNSLNMKMRYMLTKLLNIYFVRELSERLKDSSVTVLAVNPGLCKTDATRELQTHLWYRIMIKVQMYFTAITPAEGARKIVHAAIEGVDNEIQGKYIDNYSIGATSSFSNSLDSAKFQKSIWSETSEILVKIAPEVEHILKNG